MNIPEEQRNSPPPLASASTESFVVTTSTNTGSSDAGLPPVYTSADVQLHTSETPTQSLISGPSSPPSVLAGDGPPPGLKPGNFVTISRNEAVCDKFVIDPTLAIPEAALPPISEGEARENILLQSRSGVVKSDVYVYVAPGTMPENKAVRASIRAEAHNDKVNLRVHRDALTNAAVHVTGISKNGSAEVYLPRSFVGPFTLTARAGYDRLSGAVTATSTLFYETDGIQRGFIGDYTTTDWGADPNGWLGDALVLESGRGGCRVYYIDELISADESSGSSASTEKGFFTKLFS